MIKKLLLAKFNIIIFLLFAFSGNMFAQCGITSTTTTSSLTCGTSPLSDCGGVLYIGNGTTAMTLTMNANLNLSCLGPIRLIIRNGAAIDFSSGNYDMQLAAGSSIEIEAGGQLGAATNCSASDLIKIGTVKVASCNGEGSAETSFPGLVANGGYSSISATASPASVCGSGSFTITASANPFSGATYRWYTSASGGSSVYTGNPYTTGTISSTTTYYVAAEYSGYTTVRKPVTATVNPTSVGGSIAGSTSVCSGTNSTTLTISGHTGTITKWQSSPSSTFASSVTDIANTTTTLTAVNLITTTYYRAVVTSGVCSAANSATGIITVNAFPTAGLTSNDADNTFCSGTSVTFTATGGTVYDFKVNGVSVQSGASSTYITSALTNGQIVAVAVSNGSCTVTSSSITNTVNALPTAGLTSSDADNTFCSETSVTFTATGGTAYDFKVNGVSVQSGASSTYTTTGLTNGQIVAVTVTNASGCSVTSSEITNTVNALPATPTITAGGATTFCTGGSVNLTSSVGTTYLWSTGETTASINPTASGNYTVRVTNASGCQSASSAATVVTVNPVPTIITQPVSQLDCEGSFVNFEVVASGVGLTYTWQYKRPTDGGFITLTGAETNTTYPSAGVIRIGNVGSAQYSDGTQFQVIVSSGSCSVTSSVATLTVNEITDVSGGTNVTQCFGTNYSYTVSTSHDANVVSYQWKKSVASGVWNNITNGGAYSGADTATLTITGGTPAETAEYRVYITFNNSTTECSVDSSTRTRMLTFLPQFTTPVTTITQPTCLLNTGTITVTVQSASDTYSFDNGANFQSSNEKSGLAVGFYDVIIKNTAGCISPTATCQIISDTSTWDGTTWLNGNPDATRGIVFNGNYSSSWDLVGCSCQVTNGANVVINGGHTLKVTNAVAVVSGSLTFENNASLVQVNDFAVNSGNIIYKRTTTPIFNTDYVYWSSPVVGFTLGSITTGTLYYSFNGAANSWVRRYASTSMTAGMGYIVRGAGTGLTTGSTFVKTATFTGNPNNGVITASIGGANTFNLIGNPYPSAIDANAFLTANTGVLEGTLYFWTHNSAIQLATNIDSDKAGSGTYAYTSDDYATYNLTGPTVAVSGAPLPTGKIAAGQGFIATGFSAGNAVFNNSMRLSSGGAVLDNTQFFKQTRTSKTVAKVEKSRIWLNLTNAQGAFKQILVGYVAGATNAYDRAYDGVNYNGNKYVNFYSVNNTTNLTVQGRALPFDITDEVPLGYSSTIVGEFSISIDKTDGLFVSQDVFLEDKLLNVIHDLKQTAYVFSSVKGQFNERFVLRYKEKEIDTVNLSTASGKVLISNKNKQVKVNSLTSDLIDKVFVYDVTGRILYKKENVNSSEFSLINIVSKNQMLLVKSVLQNGQVVISKIIY